MGGGGGAVVGASVLVVDDQPANVLLLESLLSRLGATEICSVTDSRLALETFRRVRPRLTSERETAPLRPVGDRH